MKAVLTYAETTTLCHMYNNHVSVEKIRLELKHNRHLIENKINALILAGDLIRRQKTQGAPQRTRTAHLCRWCDKPTNHKKRGFCSNAHHAALLRQCGGMA